MTTAFSPLDGVTAALVAALNVRAMTDLVPGGISDEIGQDRVYPFLFLEVLEDATEGAMGTKAGVGLLSLVEITLHAYSTKKGMRECQRIIAKALELVTATDALKASLLEAGYKVCGCEPFYDGSTPLPDELLNGVPVRELVAKLRLYVEGIVE